MNEIMDLILHRRSLHSFDPDPIPEQSVNAILQAACCAPYGGPDEPRKFFVVTKDETKRQLLDIMKQGQDRSRQEHGETEGQYWNTYFAQAPVVIAVFFKPTSMGGHPERIELGIGVASAACSIQNMLLASLALGLGAGWVGPADESKKEFEEFFGVEPPWEFFALIPVGKPRGRTRRDAPKPVGDNVVYFDA